MSAADSDTEVSAVEEVQGDPPTEPIVVSAALTLEELQRQIAELTVRHTKDVADLSNRNKDLELELLRERDSRREAETQLLKKQFAESSKGKDKEIDLDSETNWRKLEEYYDSLAYVPVSRFQSRIPFTGPDPRYLPNNVDRPQAFDLYGDRVADQLESAKGSLRHEYAITEPLLWYLHGLVLYCRAELSSVIYEPTSTEKEREEYLEPALNSLERIHEWLAARNDLVKRLSGALGEHSDASLVKLLNSELYQRVAKRPPTSSWMEAIQSKFNDKRTDASITALAKQQAVWLRSASSRC